MGRMTKRRERFVEALLISPTVKEAAQIAGIHLRSAWDLLRDPVVRGEYEARRNQLFQQALDRILKVAWVAVEALVDIAQDPRAQAAARVAAAGRLLEASLKLHEIKQLSERLARLEARLAVEGEIIQEGRETLPCETTRPA